MRNDDNTTTTTSRLNIILREPGQIELLKACMERLSLSRGGVKMSAVQSFIEVAKFYLENADKIDPVSDTMRALAEKGKQR